MNSIIQLKNVNKSFGIGDNLTQVLFDINLSLDHNKIIFIMGPSGCGKTTLISIVAGILNSDNGIVEVLGTNQKKLSIKEKALFRSLNFGFVFQQFNLVQNLTVSENVAIPLLIQGKDFSTALECANYWIRKVGLAEKSNLFPKNLSGGQQQRVAIARALVNEPGILICDEPTASLDGRTGHKIMELVSNIATDAKKSTLVVTHDNRIFQYADIFVRMEDGRIQDVTKN